MAEAEAAPPAEQEPEAPAVAAEEVPAEGAPVGEEAAPIEGVGEVVAAAPPEGGEGVEGEIPTAIEEEFGKELKLAKSAIEAVRSRSRVETHGPVYGGCEGPNAMYIKIISSDGHEFVIRREYCMLSGTIKAMLSGPGEFAEDEPNEILFREVPSNTLKFVCSYFLYKQKYMKNPDEIPEFPVPSEYALDVLMAANFLDC